MQSFSALLDTLNQASPERQPAIEQLILDTFQRRKAVLALDMSGFTLTVRRDGILAYLRQIRRMQQITTPLVLAYHGAVVKNEADNLAYKLGEDIARPGELLVTQAIRDQLGTGTGMVGLQLHDMTVSVSGLAVQAYAVTPIPR